MSDVSEVEVPLGSSSVSDSPPVDVADMPEVSLVPKLALLPSESVSIAGSPQAARVLIKISEVIGLRIAP